MKRSLLLACLLLAGCSILPSGSAVRGSRLLPWNWGASDSTAKVEKAQAESAKANTGLRKSAQRNAHATAKAIEEEKQRQLAASGSISRQLETAADYAGRTVRDLDASEGFLAFDVQRELSEMVRLRNSEVIDERARGDRLLAANDKLAEKAATLKVTADRKLAEANAKVGEEQQRALVAEEKWNRAQFWFWTVVIGLLVLWLAGQVFTRLAVANPALAPFAMLYNKVAAPALHSAWENIADTPERIGKIMAAIRKEAPAIVAQAEPLFDRFLNDNHQAAAAAAAKSAGSPPTP